MDDNSTAPDHIRVGIVGAGDNTRQMHIPGLKAIAGVSLAGVVNRSRESSARVAEEYGIPRIYKNWAELVSDPEIDAVMIGTWPNLHVPVTVAALDAGKHVLCEARMSRHASGAHAMLIAAESRPDLVAQLVPAPDTLHVDKTISRLVAEDYLGDVLAVDVRASFDSFVARPDTPLGWRQDADISGVNVLALGIWYEAVMRWVGEAVRVSAMTRVFGKTRTDAAGNRRAVTVPDHVEVLAEMACGAQAHFQLSSVSGFAAPPEASLYGSEGTLRVIDDKLYGGKRVDDGLSEITIPAGEAGAWRVEEEFINAIRGVEDVRLTTFADGVRYMEFTEAVARSSASGQAVPLPLLG